MIEFPITIEYTIEGELQNVWPEYRWLRPVMPPIDLEYYRDTSRLYPDQEYPRFTSISPPPQRVEEVVTVRLVVRERKPDTWRFPVELWLAPNEFTQAREAVLIASGEDAQIGYFRHATAVGSLESVARALVRTIVARFKSCTASTRECAARGQSSRP